MAQPSQPPAGLPLLALGHVFLRIGATAFGGLETYLALIERELVTKRQWLTAADMTEALIMADRIAVMHQGHSLQVGTPEQLLAHPGHPHVAALLETPRRQAARLEDLMRATPS